MIEYLKKLIKYYRYKNRYPKSLLYFGVNVDSSTTLGKHTVLFPHVFVHNSSIDDYSYVQKSSEVIDTDISKFCSIASGVSIGLASHPTHLLSSSPIFYDNDQPLPHFFVSHPTYDIKIKRTEIAADVWIGQNVMIISGVKIGVGAVIGAGAVVTKDVEPYSIVAGVAAKHLKYRFGTDLREKLIESKWWELEDEELIELSSYFNEPLKFTKELEKRK